jgi:hypothetical protein
MDAHDRPGWNPPELPGLEPTTGSAPDVIAAGPRRSRIGTGVAIAAIGIGALGVAGTAYATNSTPTPTPSATGSTGSVPPGYAAPGGAGPAQGMPGRPDGDGPTGGWAGHGRAGLGMGGGMGIHGSFVVPKQGGYQTVDGQVGTVTGVSATSITVRSVDGFTQSYTIDAATMVNAQRDGIAAVKTGDEVGVVAIESGSGRTAVQIVDRTQLGAAHQRLAPPQQPGGSAPSSTSTA